MSTKVTTGEVRLSYVHLFEPWSNDPDKDKRFSVTLLIPKSDTATMDKIYAAEAEAKERDKGKWQGKIPANLKSIIHDGDEEGDLEQNPEQAGHFYMSISASEAYPPGIVGPDVEPLMDRASLFSGCYGRVVMDAYGYNTSGNRGVSFGLRNVMLTRQGEMLGGTRSSAEEDFSEFAGDGAGESLI